MFSAPARTDGLEVRTQGNRRRRQVELSFSSGVRPGRTARRPVRHVPGPRISRPADTARSLVTASLSARAADPPGSRPRGRRPPAQRGAVRRAPTGLLTTAPAVGEPGLGPGPEPLMQRVSPSRGRAACRRATVDRPSLAGGPPVVAAEGVWVVRSGLAWGGDQGVSWRKGGLVGLARPSSLTRTDEPSLPTHLPRSTCPEEHGVNGPLGSSLSIPHGPCAPNPN
jgi:hypothetical protein